MATIKKAGFSEKCALLCVYIGRSYTRCLFREHSRQRQKGHHNNTNIWEECDDYQALASRLEKAKQEIKALAAAGDVNLEPMEELRFVYLLIAINRIILYSPQPKFVSAHTITVHSTQGRTGVTNGAPEKWAARLSITSCPIASLVSVVPLA